mgnify:CR=1 FL=1
MLTRVIGKLRVLPGFEKWREVSARTLPLDIREDWVTSMHTYTLIFWSPKFNAAQSSSISQKELEDLNVSIELMSN